MAKQIKPILSSMCSLCLLRCASTSNTTSVMSDKYVA
jgi:hypothetical protein